MAVVVIPTRADVFQALLNADRDRQHYGSCRAPLDEGGVCPSCRAAQRGADAVKGLLNRIPVTLVEMDEP